MNETVADVVGRTFVVEEENDGVVSGEVESGEGTSCEQQGTVWVTSGVEEKVGRWAVLGGHELVTFE